MIEISRLNALQSGAMLALRLYVGGFLIWGVWDNITSTARMAEFEAFLAGVNCPLPAIAAPLSVWAQFAIGVALIPGVLTRWAGLLLSLNFIVAVALLWGAGADGRGLFPPAILIFVGLILATYGAGRWSLDHRFDRR
ncbi:DoxX family protein [Brevundimonas sp.]|uniref:DoxX family protein n=1 Tax=Brevundimonas sp. TaxID=1871086 RepID=UPI003918B2A0